MFTDMAGKPMRLICGANVTVIRNRTWVKIRTLLIN